MKKKYVFIFFIFLSSCNIFSEKNNKQEEDSLQVPKSMQYPRHSSFEPKDKLNDSDQTVINVEPTLTRPQLFLVMKDQATNEKDAHEKLKIILNNLSYIQKKYNLETVAPMVAWHTQKPFTFIEEGGLPLAKPLNVNEPGTYYKHIKREKAVVAHFFGKRSLLNQAYDSLNAWLNENHEQAKGNPWEQYTSDHKVMKDNTFLETDVYILVK